MIKYIKESTNTDDIYDKLLSAGYTKNSVTQGGITVKDDIISVSKTIADGDLEVNIEYDDGSYLGEPSYMISFMGDREDDYMQNVDALSLGACTKLAKLADKYFDEYPVTSKFMKEFANKYGLKYGF